MSGNTSTGDAKSYAVVAGAVLALIFVPMLVVDHSLGRSSTKPSDVNIEEALARPVGDAEKERMIAKMYREGGVANPEIEAKKAMAIARIKGRMSSRTDAPEIMSEENAAILKSLGLE